MRQDIADASSGQTIAFSSQRRGQIITLTSGELDVTNSIAIHGLGASKLAISGGGSSRIFQINSGADVTISGLTIADVLAADGAGIVNQGTLTLVDCSVTGNEANGEAGSPVGFVGFGGGLENMYGATMTVEDSTISGNESVGDAEIGGQAQGGDAASGGAVGQGIGGGLYLATGSTATLKSTVVAGNFASTSHDDIFGTYTSS